MKATNINITDIKETDLVAIRMHTAYGYSDTWWRVMFVDTNGTFVGKLERCHWYEYQMHKKGDIETLLLNTVQHIYVAGEQFCYSDKITICECEGLCREK